MNFPDWAKGEKIVFVSDWTQYNFVSVSERKMVDKVEQGGENGGMGRNEEVRTTVMFATLFSYGNGIWICIFYD